MEALKLTITRIGGAPELREENDPYGRKFCRFRKALPQPVLGVHGEGLNLEEWSRRGGFHVDPFIKDLQDMTGEERLNQTIAEVEATEAAEAEAADLFGKCSDSD